MLKFSLSATVALACLAGIVVALGAYVLVSTPQPSDIKKCIVTKMFEVRLCPTDANYVRLRDVSAHARNAIIVSEDGSFYSHEGFDWTELEKSMEKNWQKGMWARGGSTISQQLAKNVYLTAEKSVLRKVREALIVLQLEKLLTKDEILEKYLNVVEFGKNVYGIRKAASHYFGKHPSELTIAEGAFLAFLLPNPKSYEVSFHKKQLTRFARSQTREIIRRLARFRKISEEERESALVQVDYLFGGAPPAEEIPDGLVEPSPEEMLESWDFSEAFEELPPEPDEEI